jgi:cathepsin B
LFVAVGRAHGVTEALTDRYCTMENITTQLSATDVAFCCKSCGAGCGGGDPEKALDYLNQTGAFTSTCRPYDQGDHRSKHPWPQPKGRDVCPSTCDDGEDLPATRHRGGRPYRVPHDVDKIKLELLTYGPAGTQMTVYSDFGSYQSGVYTTECGKPPPLGKQCQAWGHAVKILGWGHAMVNMTSFDPKRNATVHKMQDTPYWIGANSWSRDWGEGGFFRIMHDTVGFDGSIGTQHPVPAATHRKMAAVVGGSKGGLNARPSPEQQLRHALALEAARSA